MISYKISHHYNIRYHIIAMMISYMISYMISCAAESFDMKDLKGSFLESGGHLD